MAGLFRYLIEKRAASNNAPGDVKKLLEKSKDRETLTPEQIVLVKKRLYDYNRPFYNFMMIFYYSGGRETELMKLKGCDVDLAMQTYKTEVLKGQQNDITRTIRTISLPFWREQMQNCKPGDYVFSRNLLSIRRKNEAWVLRQGLRVLVWFSH